MVFYDVFTTALNQPFSNARILIQLGYEPLKPYAGHTLMGKPSLFYPNVFVYMKYMYETHNINYCLTGLSAKLLQKYFVHLVFGNQSKKHEMNAFIESSDSDRDFVEPGLQSWTSEANCGLFDSERFIENMLNNLLRRSNPVSRTYSLMKKSKNTFKQILKEIMVLVVSYPFDVLAIHSIAHLVDGRNCTLVHVFHEIVAEKGLLGFYQGFDAKCVSAIIYLLAHKLLAYGLHRIDMIDTIDNSLWMYSTKFLSRMVSYPFELVSVCMSVNNTKFRNQMAPFNMQFRSSLHCYKLLEAANELSRGSRFFNRVYDPSLRKLVLS